MNFFHKKTILNSVDYRHTLFSVIFMQEIVETFSVELQLTTVKYSSDELYHFSESNTISKLFSQQNTSDDNRILIKLSMIIKLRYSFSLFIFLII